MAATVIDGKAVAARVRAEVARDVAAVRGAHGRAAGPGDDPRGRRPGVRLYVAGKQKASAEVGIARLRPPPPGRRHARGGRRADRPAERRPRRSTASSASCRCPPHLDGVELTGLIDPARTSTGSRRSAPACWRSGRDGSAAVHAARRDAAARRGRRRSSRAPRRSSSAARTSFGKPMAQLLLGANATVTICHSRTRDLAGGLPPRRRPVAAVGRAAWSRATGSSPARPSSTSA